MTPLKIILEGDGAFPKIDIDGGELKAIAVLEAGMSGGSPSVAVLLELPTGEKVVAQTSLALIATAIDMFIVKHGDPRAAVMPDAPPGGSN